MNDYERKCYWRGKTFFIAPYHQYKEHDSRGSMHYFCKYTCMLRFREERERQKKYKKRGLKE